MIFGEKSKIIKNRRILSPIYVPEILQDREKEVGEIAFFLRNAIEKSTPPDLLLLGVSGSGKTVCIKHVLKELKKKADILAKYIVANGTAYQVITDLARSCDVDVPLKGLGFMDVWGLLKKRVEGKITIFILDEIDKCLLKGGEDLLYFFSRHPDICTIGISNKLTVMNLINDTRVLSSFRPRKITFSSYNAEQLKEILEWRAERAFYSGVWEDSVIPLCAALATRRDGDARYALDLLTFGAESCIKREGVKVTEDDVRGAEKEVEVEFIRRTIVKLGLTQKILLFSVLNSKKNTPPEIYRYYNDIAENFGGRRLTQNWLSGVSKELELLGLVKIEKRGRGRGKGTDWYIFPPPDIDREILMQGIERALL